MLVRIIDGALQQGPEDPLMSTAADYQIERVGIFRPKQEMLDELGPGEVGFFTAAIKEVADTRVGDTVTDEQTPDRRSRCRASSRRSRWCSADYSPSMPPSSRTCARRWRRLRLNDASFSYEMETSAALGFGFRCGFLGLLHLEIITERLEREFNLDLITTAPSVIYHIYLTDGTKLEMHNPADMPDPTRIDRIEEPWIEATILVPDEHLGAVLKLCQDRRGRQKDLTYAGNRAHARLRAAAQRGGVRLLRPAEIDQPRLRLLRLPDPRLRGGRPREDVDPRQRRAGRCAVDDRASRARREPAAAPCARS